MPQIKKAIITMKVETLIIDQEQGLNEQDSQLVLGDYLQRQIYFPLYEMSGEINGTKYDIELRFLKKSPELLNLELTDI